jgi:serine/threonine protein kinase
MHQLLDGVQFLHDSNFVHRDLKLENLMIDGSGCLKIGDEMAMLASVTLTHTMPSSFYNLLALCPHF